MKDNVFIVWNGSKDVACKVKQILEEKMYNCVVGGNFDNSSSMLSVGDTVIKQLKNCNQAIVIFKKRTDGKESGNLYFELGYALATYGPQKVHCVKSIHEDILLPSDFDNAFVEPILGDNEQDYANNIVQYFLKRQKSSIDENKIALIDNRYRMRDCIQRHFSQEGSLCSDYELAQYLLFYVQAAHMFADEKNVLDELEKFKSKQAYFAEELSLSVNKGIAFLKMLRNVKKDQQENFYVDRNNFVEYKQEAEMYRASLENNDFGVFGSWAKVFSAEHLTYAYSLVANNKNLPDQLRKQYSQKTCEWAKIALADLQELDSVVNLKINNDRNGIVALLSAYVYVQLYYANKYLGNKQDSIDALEKSKQERLALKNNYFAGTIDSSLCETFVIEYYLVLVEYLKNKEYFNLDDDEEYYYKEIIQDFVNSMRAKDLKSLYLSKMEGVLKQN